MAISQNHFENACLALETTHQRLDIAGRWDDAKVVRNYDSKLLHITRRVNDSRTKAPQTNGGESEIIEVDDEIVNQTQDGGQDLLIIYDIAHSSSYQVPVLYITFKPYSSNDTALSILPSLDEVYELSSPPSLRAQMQAVGIMGALSMTDHPVSGAPAYFVHPCRTAEAMEAVMGRESVSPARYLLLWMGLVGQGVGLDVPTEIAEAMSEGW